MNKQIQIGHRLATVRDAAGLSQGEAGAFAGLSQSTMSRIEDGTRPMRADELIMLADAIGVRASAIVNVDSAADHAQFAARTDGTSASMDMLKEHLLAYFELDHYLTEQGIPAA